MDVENQIAWLLTFTHLAALVMGYVAHIIDSRNREMIRKRREASDVPPMDGREPHGSDPSYGV